MEAPVIDCPLTPFANQLPDGVLTMPITWEDPQATDNSAEELSVFRPMQPFNRDKGDEFPAGTYEIEYRATDSSGNTGICIIVIIVTGKQNTFNL